MGVVGRNRSTEKSAQQLKLYFLHPPRFKKKALRNSTGLSFNSLGKKQNKIIHQAYDIGQEGAKERGGNHRTDRRQ